MSEKLVGGLRLKTRWAGEQTKVMIKGPAGQVVFRGTMNLSFWSKIKVALDSLGETKSAPQISVRPGKDLRVTIVENGGYRVKAVAGQ